MERPKRIITKPPRYITTSSDEAPNRRKGPSINTERGEIQDDIDDIRNILDKDYDENSNEFNNNNNHNYITHTQHASSHIYTHIDTHTNVNRLNNVSENMNFPSHAIIPSYSSQSFITSMQSPYTPSTVSQMTCTPIPSAVLNYTSRANNDVNTNIPTYIELQNIFPTKNAETSFPSCQESGSFQPGPSQPGLSQPGPSQPGPSQPGPSQPGSSQPRPSQPGPSQPGSS